MGHTANIVIGLLAVAFGNLMIFVITPAQIVEAFFATVQPSFYPDAASVLLIASGAGLVVSGVLAPRAPVDWAASGRHAAVFAVALAGLCTAALLTPRLGFLPVAVAVTAATLALMRQRMGRVFIAVTLLAPAVVWVAFDRLLQRPLP